MNDINEVVRMLSAADDQLEIERMESTYRQWRFGFGVILISMFFLILSVSLNSAMFIAVSFLCLFIGVYYMDKGIKHPSWSSFINYSLSFKKKTIRKKSFHHKSKFKEIDETHERHLKVVNNPITKSHDD